MAGYIGSKAVTLSTTAADVTGDATINGNLTVNGTTITVDSAAAQEIRLGDNDKMTFGDATGGDLQIYHDGSHSYIKDVGTGDLYLQGTANVRITNTSGQKMFLGQDGGEAQLYYSGVEKLATTSTGVDITGTLTSDGLTVDGASSIRHSDATTNISLTPTSTGGVVNVRDSSGNSQIVLDARTSQVGIGTTSPSAKLDLQGTAAGDEMLEITHSGASQPWKFISGESGVTNESLRISRGASGEWMRFHAGLGTVFYYDGTERMRIDSSGNVGIGTSSPSAPIQAKKSTTGVETILDLTASTGAYDRGPAVDFSVDWSGEYTLSRIHSINQGIGSGYAASLIFSTNGPSAGTLTERMRIDSSGNVGIGTSSPSTPLHIKDSNGGLVQTIETGDSNAAYTKYINSTTGSGAFTDGLLVGIDTDESATFWQYEASHMKFGTSGTERMRIDSSGNLIFGKTTTAVTTAGVTLSQAARFNVATTGGEPFYFYYAVTGAAVGSITHGTTSTSFNTTSDYRLKENVTDVTDGIARVKQLAPRRFNFIAEPDITVDGFIAHEAQAVVPEAVTKVQDAMRDEEYEVTAAVLDEDGNVVTEAVMGTRSVPDYQGIDQSKLVPLLTAALQEAIAKIETLETEMTSVKARLDALEAE